MDMVGEGFLTTLTKSLKEGKITLKEIDDACRLILEAKYKLGLFDDPYKYCDVQRSKTDVYTDASRRTARRIAAESCAAENNNRILPLKKNPERSR